MSCNRRNSTAITLQPSTASQLLVPTHPCSMKVKRLYSIIGMPFASMVFHSVYTSNVSSRTTPLQSYSRKHPYIGPSSQIRYYFMYPLLSTISYKNVNSKVLFKETSLTLALRIESITISCYNLLFHVKMWIVNYSRERLSQCSFEPDLLLFHPLLSTLSCKNVNSKVLFKETLLT